MGPDPDFLGLPGLDLDKPFAELFESVFYPLLGRRADGFKVIFDVLGRGTHKPLIVETGCLRAQTNWVGDGQSTFMFDRFVDERHGLVFSIDLNPANIATARRACGPVTVLMCNDGAVALNALAETMRGRQVDLLYLDSFDVGSGGRAVDPVAVPVHYAAELAAARPLLGTGSLVVVDDCTDQGVAEGFFQEGKALAVEVFLAKIAAPLIHDGYQKVWMIP